jgi:hypothetical protein
MPDELYFSFEMNHNKPYEEYHGIRYAPDDEPIDGDSRYEQARKSVTDIRDIKMIKNPGLKRREGNVGTYTVFRTSISNP